MTISRFALIAPLALLSGLAHAQDSTAAAATTLSVTLTGIEAKPGPIMLGVFDAANWKNGKPLRGEMLYPKDGEVRTTLAGLPAGTYGIKAFHDYNGNGKLDTNPFGMPTEPFAFSNNARGSGGPAKWADAAFTVAAGTTAQTITIR